MTSDGNHDGRAARPEVDQRILLSLQHSSNVMSAPWMLEFGRDVTALGGTAVLSFITLSACAYLLLEGRWGAAILVLAAVEGGNILQDLLKLHFERPRPPAVLPGAELDTWSFPSGHAMMSAIVYLAMARLIVREQSHLRVKIYVMAVAITLTLSVGVSRIYLGLHWPTDVLGGWTLGTAWALLCCTIANGVESLRGNRPYPGD